jgi:hypothetical protein
MYKLGRQESEQWVEHVFAPIFCVSTATNHAPRIIAGIPKGDSKIFERLTLCLEPPYFLLYVLHTPRGEGAPGRYQSPELTTEQVSAFLRQFRSLLSTDARYDLWAYSPSEQATVVWDRHNQLFAYGPITKFVQELRQLGFSEGSPDIPCPHEHNYRAENDQDAGTLLQTFDWSYSPLHPEDEQ